MLTVPVSAAQYIAIAYKLEELWSLAPNAVFGEAFTRAPRTDAPVRFRYIARPLAGFLSFRVQHASTKLRVPR